MSIDRKTLLKHCRKCRLYIRLGMHVADARLELRRAHKLLLKLRQVRGL